MMKSVGPYESKRQLIKQQIRKAVTVLSVIHDNISRRLTGMLFKKPQPILEHNRIGFPLSKVSTVFGPCGMFKYH
jgi:hypothetical protein